MSRHAVTRFAGLAIAIGVTGLAVSLATGAGAAPSAVHRGAAANPYKYVYHPGKVAGHKFAVVNIKCPASNPRPIGGLFGTGKPDAFLMLSQPGPPGTSAGKANSWVVGVKNTAAQTADVAFGAVCAK